MKSIIHNKDDRTCYLCMILHNQYSTQINLEEHHVVYGRGQRKLSGKYGLKVYLCNPHHQNSPESIHNNTAGNKAIDLQLKAEAQQAFQEHFPSLSFREIFGINYLDESIKPQSNNSLDGFIEIEGINESTKGMAYI